MSAKLTGALSSALCANQQKIESKPFAVFVKAGCPYKSEPRAWGVRTRAPGNCRVKMKVLTDPQRGLAEGRDAGMGARRRRHHRAYDVRRTSDGYRGLAEGLASATERSSLRDDRARSWRAREGTRLACSKKLSKKVVGVGAVARLSNK